MDNDDLNLRLRQNFDGKIVRKDLTKKIKEGANVPVYVLEFLLGQHCSSEDEEVVARGCLLYTSPSPRDISGSRMPSSA